MSNYKAITERLNYSIDSNSWYVIKLYIYLYNFKNEHNLLVKLNGLNFLLYFQNNIIMVYYP